jgi:type IV pilus biogenesis protein CpaD/CtpE
MVKKISSIVAVALFTLSLAGSAQADEVTGNITKVGEGGRSITVKSKDKEVTVNISGSRTTLDGVGSRADLKEGQNVTVEYKGDAASKIKVTKAK